MYDEKCYCPEQDQDKWLHNLQCASEIHPQIIQDLSIFPTIDLGRLASESSEQIRATPQHVPLQYNKHIK